MITSLQLSKDMIKETQESLSIFFYSSISLFVCLFVYLSMCVELQIALVGWEGAVVWAGCSRVESKNNTSAAVYQTLS